MKPNDSRPGWLNCVLDLGCKTTYSPAPLGRTEWLIKKDGQAIKVLQGKNTSLTTKIDNPTDKQRGIAALLVTAGIAVVTS